MFVRPLLFSLSPETSHKLTNRLLKISGEFPPLLSLLEMGFSFRHPALSFQLFDKKFLSPVGLAAGFDKNCELFLPLSAFGFGFIESGTLTPLPQEGNPKPRILRLQEEKALLNRLGFNNCGGDAARKNLRRYRKKVPLGLSIGRNSSTPNKDSSEDYLILMEKLFPFADYFAVNVSSPNTPGLVDLQYALSELLPALQEKNQELAQKNGSSPKALFVKISPDLELKQLERIAEECIQNQIQGLITTNTTTSYNQKQGIPADWGLSGLPLKERSTKMIRHLFKNFGKKLYIIGVGGIFSAEDAYSKIKAGASLVQLYTGWIYEGPGLIRKINEELVQLLARDGFKNVQEAVGIEC